MSRTPQGTEVLPVVEPSLPLPLPMPLSLPTVVSGDATVTKHAGATRMPRIEFGSTPRDGSLFHTLLPRTMVMAGLLAALGSPLLAFVLERQGHLELDGRDWTLDDRGRSIATAAVGAIFVCSVLGWAWWTTAAALNARRQARYTVSPWFAPIAIALIVLCARGALSVFQSDTLGDDAHTKKVLMMTGLIAVAVIAHFTVLEGYRRAAGVIGASQRPWLVVILLPWAALALNGLAQFFANAVADSYLKVSGLANLMVLGVNALALYQAMSSFDRACSGRHMVHSDHEELPEFMRGLAS